MDVLSDISGVVRYDGMHKYSKPLLCLFNLIWNFRERNHGQCQGRYEGNVRPEVPFSKVLLLLHFPGY
jgi:hypothetical protein